MFREKSRHDLLDNLEICGIDFRHKKQLRSGVLVKIEPEEESTGEYRHMMDRKLRQKDELYVVDKKDYVTMGEWLRAVPDRTTIYESEDEDTFEE